MANLVLKQIERGSVSFAAADTTKTVTLGTTLTATSKSLLLFSVRCDSGSALNYHVLGKIISTTQIQFERAGSPGIAAVVEYQVIEFISGINVQHIEVTPTGATTSVAITSVNTARTFVIGTVKQTGTTYGADDCALYDLTSSTNVDVITQSFTSSLISSLQVVEIDDASVQKVSTSAWTSGATTDITVTSITENQTMFVFALNDNANMNCDQWVYMSYVNSTTVRLNKNFSGSFGSKNAVCYVVSIPVNFSVQNISTTIASSGSSVSPSISTVTVANTALHIVSMNQHLASASETNDEGGTGSFTVSNLTTTAFTATRAASTAFAATVNVQVLSFSTSSGSWFLLPAKNELTLNQNINDMR